MSSLAAMWAASELSGHVIWNQWWVVLKAPQLNVPDASESTSLEIEVTGKNDIPFHFCRRAFHHIKSAREIMWRRM
jgi:hypothetical protein